MALTFRFDSVVVEPDKLLPIASLFLRWPFKTAEKINNFISRSGKQFSSPVQLALYEFEQIYFQQTPTDTHDYVGFIIKLIPIPAPEQENYAKYIKKFGDIFVLKDDIVQIEKLNRDYCSIPLGHSKERNKCLCTEENLHTMAPRIFHSIFENPKRTSKTTPFKFTKKHLRPCFGTDVVKPIKDLPSRSIREDEKEIIDFINVIKKLKQTDPYCLAKIVKTRYPHIKHADMARLIEPDTFRTNATATRTVNRWLT